MNRINCPVCDKLISKTNIAKHRKTKECAAIQEARNKMIDLSEDEINTEIAKINDMISTLKHEIRKLKSYL